MKLWFFMKAKNIRYSCTYNKETGKSEQIDWRRTIDEFIDDSDDDIVFVGIDYHI